MNYAGAADNNPWSGGGNGKVQDHNSSRSNKSSTKAQDHNSSRSNKTASIINPGGGGGGSGGSLRVMFNPREYTITKSTPWRAKRDTYVWKLTSMSWWGKCHDCGSRQFSTISNVLKSKHDTAKNSISNIR